MNKEILILREALKNCSPNVAIAGFVVSRNCCEVVGKKRRNECFSFVALAVFGVVVCCFYRLCDDAIQKILEDISFGFV